MVEARSALGSTEWRLPGVRARLGLRWVADATFRWWATIEGEVLGDELWDADDESEDETV